MPTRPLDVARTARAVSATAAGALGLADVVAGIHAPHAAPTMFLPPPVLGAGPAALTCGLLLLLLAGGLARGLRSAWLLTLTLLLQAALAAPIEHQERALLALLPIAVLWLHRADFAAPARAPRWGTSAVLAGFALAWLVAPVLQPLQSAHMRAAAFARIAGAADTDDHLVALRALAQRGAGGPLLPLTGACAVVLLIVGARGITRPGQPRPVRDPAVERALAEHLFARHGANPVSFFAAAPDKALWTEPRGRGAVAFRLIGSIALVVGDPLGAPDDRAAVLDGFVAHCRRSGWTPAFYQTLPATLPLYRTHGFRALAMGQEAIIDLPGFSLVGKKIANVRHSVTHAERAGLGVELCGAQGPDAATQAAMAALSREWLSGKGGGEMGFSMGRLSADGRPSPGARVAVARDADGCLQAFLTLNPAGGGRGWTLDLMRRRAAAPSGTMDLLIARTAEALRDEGYATFSLSLAPMASAPDTPEDAPALARRARDLLYERMDGAYNYRALYSFKKKFNVRWEPRYLVYAGDAHLPAALYATARAHLPATLVSVPALPAPVRRLGRAGARARGA